ncbi:MULTISPECIES: hypothetical protein [Sphingobacterium]|uniref:hypothetical protein n=1 Tax=Sphingobacterium TaxID=28453 RepID=UPI00104FB410|nr:MULTISPECIES: hypothetical protein [Sphingobacterium]MCW2261341.1 hypothetical protein [Sphingobacterium kitahiroshimense]TCR07816.1 hypothetical protein EDF67_10894 [Sphingobacterium sp. JUb78]
MTKKIFYGVAVLALISSCAKDSGTPDPDFSKDIQVRLGAYVWHPVIGNAKETDYNLDDCEMDNSYRFIFQEKSNQLNLDKGVKVCEANKGAFEEFIFKDENNTGFTFNKEKGTIKFANQDQYSSYTVVVNGDKLVLTSQNNNPAAFVRPVKYYFKGVKAQ